MYLLWCVVYLPKLLLVSTVTGVYASYGAMHLTYTCLPLVLVVSLLGTSTSVGMLLLVLASSMLAYVLAIAVVQSTNTVHMYYGECSSTPIQHASVH